MKRLALVMLLSSLAARADTATLAIRGGSAFVGGHPDRDSWAATAGIEGLWRSNGLLLGGALDASSRVGSLNPGTVRHLFFAGEAGMSFAMRHNLRFDLIGEFGAHRLSGSRSGPFRVSADVSDANLVDVWLASDPAWSPFVGARPSLELLFDEMALGFGAWARADLIALDPPTFLDPAPFPVIAQHSTLGRFSAGADVHLAVRFH